MFDMITIKPIYDEDLHEIALFLNQNLNSRISYEIWMSAFRQSWAKKKPNNGFMIKNNNNLAGVLGAIYSDQIIEGIERKICNLTSLFVEEEYRGRTFELFTRCLSQKECEFTNFTANEAVEKICRLLKFRKLKVGYYVVPHFPLNLSSGVCSIPVERAGDVLGGETLRAYRAHCGFAWLETVIFGRNGGYCLLIYRRGQISRLKLPAATILYVSDPTFFLRYSRSIGSYLFIHRRLAAARIDRRLLPEPPPHTLERQESQTLLFRGTVTDDSAISNLYSELVALPI